MNEPVVLSQYRETADGRPIIIDGQPADLFGRKVSVGDTVVYPVREGSMMSLEHGVVDSLSQSVSFAGTVVPVAKIRKSSGKLVSVSSFPRVVIVAAEVA